MPKHPGHERRDDGARTDQPGQVEQLCLAEVDPAAFVGGVHGGHDQSGGDDHQDDAGHPEEPGQVDPHPAPVDAVAQARPPRGCRAGRPPRWRVDGRWRGRRRAGRPTVSKPSRSTARNAMMTSARAEPRGQRRCGGRAPGPLQIPGVAAHPDDHVGHHHDRDTARRPSPAAPDFAAASPTRRSRGRPRPRCRSAPRRRCRSTPAGGRPAGPAGPRRRRRCRRSGLPPSLRANR